MIISKILATAAIISAVSANAVFAVPQTTAGNNEVKQEQKVAPDKEFARREFKGKGFHLRKNYKNANPIKMLESKKAKVQELLKEGKITQEEAKNITAKIDARIKEIKVFDSLTLKEKKEKLISNFKVMMGRKVGNGRLTQEKADELVKRYTEKINQWDGKGYPFFVFKGNCKPYCKPNKER